jgi:hypothetical protein
MSPRLIWREVGIPLHDAKAVDGIISYLAWKQRGNIHDKGIITIVSKSLDYGDPKCAVRNFADLTSDWYFRSKSGLGQWIPGISAKSAYARLIT